MNKFIYQRIGVEGKFNASTIHDLITNAAAWPQTTSDHLKLSQEFQFQILLNLEDNHTPLNAFILAVNSVLGLTIVEIHNGSRIIFQQ